ncbi:hypothetical protein J4Q44_G00374020 [Coregonus suidteri]|uniref:FH2 domain-containing protein n=1 Tax=Coregonus suidteri TaxID=861788 RepID=A0AAN8QCX1_9TELE
MMSLPPASTIPVTDGNKTGPPPPPPPPCGPPPPPPPPGAGDPVGGIRKRRVRSFFWKPIPEDQVKGRANLWTQLPVQQQEYYIDVQTIEELFGQTDCQSPGVTSVTRGGKARGSLRETKDEISILDWKRGMNVGIYLKQFKKSNQDIIEDIRYGNSQSYGAELLKELLKLLPETEEVKKLKAFRGDPSKLSLVDSFMFLLTQVPSFEVRIKAMVLREEFPPACEIMSRDIDVLRTATKELLDCEELHAILHLVLQAGNILNAGGYAGNAVGFKLSSLLSLADTKANKPGMNLLHFVALEAQKKDDKLLEFSGKLQHVHIAARISVENLDAEFQSLSSRTRSVEESIQGETELLQQLDHFLQSSTAALVELRRRRQELTKEGNILIDFFCEDKESFRLDECFKVFQDFCLKFQKAVKDNLERELKEVARRRLRELEEKRHSWAGGEEEGGVLGIRSSSETDIEVALSQEEGLIELLNSRPCSPHSPQNALGRSGSVRRSRGSASAAADRQLTNLLTLGITSDLQVVGGSPNPGRRLWRGAEQRDSSPMRSPETGLRSPNISPLTRTQLQTHGPTQPQNQHPQVDWPGLHSPSSIATSIGPRHSHHKSDVNSNHSPQTATVDHKPSTDHNQTTDPDNNNHIQITDPDPDNNHNQPSGLTVNVERHTLVPKLRALDRVLTPHGHDHHRHADQGDVVTVIDLEEEEIPGDSILTDTQKNSQGSSEGWEQRERRSDSSRRREGAVDGNGRMVAAGIVNEEPPPVGEVEEEEEERRVEEKGGPAAVSASTNQPAAVSPSTNELPASVTAGASDRSAHGTNPKTSPVSKTSRPPSTTTTSGRKTVIRTLNSSENQGMRRVVPIFKASRCGSIPGKQMEKPPGHQSSDPRTTTTSSSNLADRSPRRAERSSATPRRNSLQAEDPKAKSVTTTGARDQPQPSTLQRKPSFRKPLRPVAPRPPPEEKMCRSTLRALAATGGAVPIAGGGGGNSLSAPPTPSHRGGVSNPTPLPGFARNTAASSFRRTLSPSSLAPPVGTLTPSKTSPRSSPGPSPLSRAGSLRHHRVTPAGPPGTDSPIRRTQSIKGPLRAPILHPLPPQTFPDSLAHPKGHAGKNSSSFADKSSHSRDSIKVLKPTWR